MPCSSLQLAEIPKLCYLLDERHKYAIVVESGKNRTFEYAIINKEC